MTLFQKYATEGIISNKNYDALKNATWFYYPPIPKAILDSIRNASIWIDVSIGAGGTSGSSVWALEGKEQGKVISLHSMGIRQPLSFTKPKSGVDVDSLNFNSVLPEQNQLIKKDQYNFFATSDIGKKQVRLTAEKLGKEIFKDYSFEDSRKNRQHSDDFYKENETFMPIMKKHGKWVDMAGMNAGIPINKVKTYFQERGVDPDNFSWGGRVSKKYWWK